MREREFIQRIAKATTAIQPGLRMGIGDDCAIFQANGADFVVTTDMLVENVHFDTSWHPPYLLGRKAIGVNISDIAAMAGTPQYALLSIGLSPAYSELWLNELMDGMLSHLREFDCALIGGDTVSSEQLTINVTIIGSVEKGRAIQRNGARTGDGVFVTGPLGSAAAALNLFKETNEPETVITQWPALATAHLDPSPRVLLARMLMEHGHITAMQDISDGIATDLSHICTASNTGAVIYENYLPAHNELVRICSETAWNRMDFQLRGGEDYELLFTVNSSVKDQIGDEFIKNYGIELFEIGEIVKGSGVMLEQADGNRRPVTYQGYEHSS